MNLLISDAFAFDNNIHNNSLYSLLAMLLFFALIFYFIIYRPQNNKIKEHKKLLESLVVGDEILTSSGFLGKIKKITTVGYIILELNKNVEVLIKSDYVLSILPKGTLKII
ncbi:preprotein translocase subunit YajC [Buchnera aphidicola (Schlechtendalia chinensis)]|uniref:Sec translocon accessory complex subunit YajC n=1 Tax=Buchnera aphidicola subsp. Schlechtendalia chinensis TaxID=118110 RepID=A0A172WEF2_BUCSC|nr:preprotein translocase subunit YajC [Buchnera aphidicola]ANF17295.1 preprotein translocase subunit YajC [Buchnera aphidicola (Schlechtendalia chinensis)]